MITFFVALLVLIAGYVLYGKVVETVYKPFHEPTPCVAHPDGVDYVPISTPRCYLIQLLNIAGLGPIFGALSGALWGPVVYFWIVLGSIFAGGVHDYTSGILSMRHDGANLPQIIGNYLGRVLKEVMVLFSVVLLVLVGATFTKGPAGLLAMLTPDSLNATFWLVVLLIYYFLATLLPIDKIIGRFYPIFGICLIIMCVGIGGGILLTKGSAMPEMTLANLHPQSKAIWPFMFITVACGACSGFHATQSPIVARCISNEKNGRVIFYGAMISEGIIALIWAAAGMTFYGGVEGLFNIGVEKFSGNQSSMVYDIATNLLGPVGGVLAVIGVVACPITSADTAFRSARLTIADRFNVDQKPIAKRLALTVPLLAIGALLGSNLIPFDVVWRYFSWANQTLAMFTLWCGAVYLAQKKPGQFYYLMAAIPAAFMSAVTSTYIMIAPEGFRLPATVGYIIGLAFMLACVIAFAIKAVIPNSKPKLGSAS